MGIVAKFRAQQEAREEAFRNPGGPGAAEDMEEIAKQDPYGLREEEGEQDSE